MSIHILNGLFYSLQVGEILKEKHDNAHEVQQRKKRGRRMLLPRFQRFKPHTDTDLVYLKNSPDYCERDIAKGSLGTHGRECNPVRSHLHRRERKLNAEIYAPPLDTLSCLQRNQRLPCIQYELLNSI